MYGTELSSDGNFCNPIDQNVFFSYIYPQICFDATSTKISVQKAKWSEDFLTLNITTNDTLILSNYTAQLDLAPLGLICPILF
jgi:hypothetical protein